jgi:hypothetical protein
MKARISKLEGLTQKMSKKRRTEIYHHYKKNVKNDTGYTVPYLLENLNLGLVPFTHIDPRFKVVSV